MNIFELKIWDDERKKCTFYTVHVDGNSENETDRFFYRYADEKNDFHEESNIILRLVLENIGNKYGATDDFFDRHKNEAQALPPKPKKRIPEIEEIGIHFPLRLYCYRISESIAVLFNGGYKDNRTDQESKEISLKFYEAQQFAKKISKAIEDGTILVDLDNRTLLNFDGKKEIILY